MWQNTFGSIFDVLQIGNWRCHDFKFCKCKSVAVDGGHDYLRRVGQPEEWEDLSKCEVIEDDKTIWMK